MKILALKRCEFTDQKTNKSVSFVKVAYETEKNLDCAVLKASEENIDKIMDEGFPFELSDDFPHYDLNRQPGKMARLYIF